MAFEKGNTLAVGRPKGVPNVATFEKKNLIKYLKEEGAERFLKLLETLPDDAFCDKYLKLIEFAFPKEKQLLEHSGPGGKDLFTPLTDEQKARLADLWKAKE